MTEYSRRNGRKGCCAGRVMVPARWVVVNCGHNVYPHTWRADATRITTLSSTANTRTQSLVSSITSQRISNPRLILTENHNQTLETGPTEENRALIKDLQTTCFNSTSYVKTEELSYFERVALSHDSCLF